MDSHTSMTFTVGEETEKEDLIMSFSDGSCYDPDDVSKLYHYEKVVKRKHDGLVECFVDEVLNGDDYDGLSWISAPNAQILLRQMAMFRMDNDESKVQRLLRGEAKANAKDLTEWMGPGTEYFANVDDVTNPHDNPGTVTFNDHYFGQIDCICLIAVNEDYLLCLQQTWNPRGE